MGITTELELYVISEGAGATVVPRPTGTPRVPRARCLASVGRPEAGLAALGILTFLVVALASRRR